MQWNKRFAGDLCLEVFLVVGLSSHFWLTILREHTYIFVYTNIQISIIEQKTKTKTKKKQEEEEEEEGRGNNRTSCCSKQFTLMG